MSRIEFDVPLLPPSLNRYRKAHWREQRKVQEVWREYVLMEWIRLRKPEYRAVRVALHFFFPDRRLRDMDNYMATGGKLAGDALKGRFIPDDDPRYLKGWSFLFGLDRENPRTTILIEEVESDG